MYIISSLPNYIFTSCAAVETYCLTNKIFNNIEETNIRNNLLKNGFLIVVKSILIIGTAALTTQYPIAVTISLLAIHLLSPKNKTDSSNTVGFDKSIQKTVSETIENEPQTVSQTIENETQTYIQERNEETFVKNTDIFLDSIEQELSIFSESNEFTLLPSDIVTIIKDLSSEIASLKKSENLEHSDIENRLFPKVKNLFQLQIINNFYEKLTNMDSNEDLKKEIRLNLPIIKFLTRYTEFQKKTHFLNNAYCNNLLEEMNNILLQEANDNFPRLKAIPLKASLLQAKMEFALSSTVEEQTTSQKIGNPPSFLKAFTYSNTSRIITRNNIANQILLRLNKKELKHTILIGEAGSGKTTILENVVERISKISRFKNFSFFKLDATAFISGTSCVGEQEKRIQKMKQFFNSLKQKDKDAQIVIIIDEIHQLTGMGTSSKSDNDVWQSLKEDLGNSKFTIIGTTTEEEYKTHIKKDSAVASRFSTITIIRPLIYVTEADIIAFATLISLVELVANVQSDNHQRDKKLSNY